MSGNYVTLYDIAVPGTVVGISAQSPDDISLQLLGTTPDSLIGSAGLTDDPELLNLTVIFRGAFLDHNALVNVISISIEGNSTELRNGTFTSRSNLGGGDLAQIGGVALPVLVPEPAALSSVGLLIALAVRRARRRR